MDKQLYIELDISFAEMLRKSSRRHPQDRRFLSYHLGRLGSLFSSDGATSALWENLSRVLPLHNQKTCDWKSWIGPRVGLLPSPKSRLTARLQATLLYLGSLDLTWRNHFQPSNIMA